jgi:SnoaL-like domain
MRDSPQRPSRRTLLASAGTLVAVSGIMPPSAGESAARPTSDGELTMLESRFAITDTLLRYFRALDRADRELLRACFSLDATLNYPGAYAGGVEGFMEFVERTVFKAWTRTMHFAGNMLIEIKDDEAFTETYAIAHHKGSSEKALSGTFLVMWLRYIDRLRRTPEGWRINRREVALEWMRSDKGGMWDDYPSISRRDRSDASYIR